MSSPDIASRLAKKGKLLIRSEMEISRILDAMVEDGDTVTATLNPELMLLSHLLFIEPVKGYMLLSYGDHKPANSAALGEGKLLLACNHRGAHFRFSGEGPHAAVNGAHPCIQCDLPSVLVALQERRTVSRLAIPARAPVTCEAQLGVLTFDAKVVDVSLDGIGTLLCDPAIRLQAGTVLTRVRIRHPQHAPIEVDLEVRYVTSIQLPSGERASRVGCRIISPAADLEEMIRLFVIDLS